jgi:replicative DNA helicase
MNLRECTHSLLSHLSDVDLSYLKKFLVDSEFSSVSDYQELVKCALEFHKETGQFPSGEYLAGLQVEFVPSNMPFDDSTRTLLDTLLKKETASNKANDLIQRGMLKEAGRILTEYSEPPVEVQKRKAEVEEMVDEYHKLAAAPSGLLTGVPEIDNLSKGCGYTTVTVIAAGPGHGKTTLSQSIVYLNSVKNKYNGIYVSLEAADRDFWFNLLSRHSLENRSKLPAEKIKKGLLTPEELKTFEEVHSHFLDSRQGEIQLFTIEDFRNFSYAEMEQKFTQKELEWGQVDYLIVDYIQLFRFYKTPHMQPEEFCNNLVRFFGQYAIKANKGKGCAVFVLSQVNREGMKRIGKTEHADLSCLAELNELERTAHLAIVLYSTEQDRLNNQMGVAVVKNRTGLVSEELKKTYADFAHFFVGSSQLLPIFNKPQKIDLLIDEVPF